MKKYLPVLFFVVALGALVYVFSDDTVEKSAQDTILRIEKMEADIKDVSKRMQEVERDLREYESMLKKVVSNEEQMLDVMQDLNFSYQELQQF